MGRSQDLGARGPGGVVTAGPWSARDSYVAETAVTLDRLSAKIERLERREEALKAQVGELLEQSQQSGRLQALAESLRNSRDYKLDEMVRLVKDVRGRLDLLEGPRPEFNALTCKSFISVDRKLAELAAGQVQGTRPARWLQATSVAAGFAAATVLAFVAERFF